MRCVFQPTNATANKKPRYRCINADCETTTYNPKSVSICGSKSAPPAPLIRDFSQLDCVHLLEISERHVQACCGGSGLIDVGVCAVVGLCSIGGAVINGELITDCRPCKYKESPKG